MTGHPGYKGSGPSVAIDSHNSPYSVVLYMLLGSHADVLTFSDSSDSSDSSDTADLADTADTADR